MTDPMVSSSVRLEHTSFFDSEFRMLRDPHEVLQIHQYAEQNAICLGKEEEHHSLPWWAALPSSAKGNVPVAFVSQEAIQKWSLFLERSLVELAYEIFRRGISHQEEKLKDTG